MGKERPDDQGMELALWLQVWLLAVACMQHGIYQHPAQWSALCQLSPSRKPLALLAVSPLHLAPVWHVPNVLDVSMQLLYPSAPPSPPSPDGEHHASEGAHLLLQHLNRLQVQVVGGLCTAPYGTPCREGRGSAARSRAVSTRALGPCSMAKALRRKRACPM